MDGYEERLESLRARLASLERVAVAFSGGVDSSALLHAARSVLGEGAVAVIADSPSLPRRELELARETARAIGATLVVIPTDEMEDDRYRANRGDRCYFCKSALFRAMEPWARANGFRALAFGEIQDDLLDVRPGARAAREFGVVAPLSESGFTKDDVRRYAREAGLEVADKPASACLSSRLPVGTAVTRERLARIERSEDALRTLGLAQLRVRDHGELARVEVGLEDLERARDAEPEIRRLLAREGFARAEIHRYLSPKERAAS
ncbi:MAG TPA: ATP-dependent sacrificial sulfur transferase LarE [Planctomycetota bacterium]|nr:ATP-dependent sacrificial sulfur transferase LarE [Planctomycetota bacterium]